MTLWKNNAQLLAGAVADNAAITVTNSASGGDAFTAVTTNGTATVTYDAANYTFVCADTGGGYVARLDWDGLWNTDVGVAEVEGYGVSGLGAGDNRILDIRSASASICRIEVDDAAGAPLLFVYSAAAGSVANSGTNYLPTSAGWRVSVGFRVSTGDLQVRLYTASDGRSATPVWEVNLTGQTLGAANSTVLRAGQLNSTQTGVVAVRNMRFDNTTLAPLGPLIDMPHIIASPGVVGVDLSGQVISGVPPYVLTAQQVGGTSVGAITVSGLIAYFAKPTVDTATVRFTITDDLAQTDTIDVEFPTDTAASGGISLWNGSNWS